MAFSHCIGASLVCGTAAAVPGLVMAFTGWIAGVEEQGFLPATAFWNLWAMAAALWFTIWYAVRSDPHAKSTVWKYVQWLLGLVLIAALVVRAQLLSLPPESFESAVMAVRVLLIIVLLGYWVTDTDRSTGTSARITSLRLFLAAFAGGVVIWGLTLPLVGWRESV